MKRMLYMTYNFNLIERFYFVNEKTKSVALIYAKLFF